MANGTCIVDSCGRTGPVKRGWCLSHYARWHKTGDVRADIPLRRSPLPAGSLCEVESCGRPYFSNGFCSLHWSRWRKHGDLLAHIPLRRPTPKASTCAVDECERQPASRVWCRKHYMRWYLHGDPLKRDGRLRAEDAPSACAVDTCDRPVQSLGWCRTHYSRWQRRGDVWEHLPIQRYRWTDQVCANDTCTKTVRTRGFCKLHYAQTLTREVNADPIRLAARREVYRKCAARTFATNPARIRAQSRAWRTKNPTAARLIDHRKRMQKCAAPTLPFTVDQFNQRMAYWGNRCWMCGGPFEAVDHVKPISRGGAHALMNMRASCRSCNSRKKDRWPYPTGTTITTRPIPLP